ncbi:MAG: glycosyltransferase family 39 protein [Bacteroidetes bacterium]|nr:glycosyltransferase family 39 protein [Bacteroidota bacterium]
MKQVKLLWIIIFLLGVAVRSSEVLHPVDTESWRESDVSTMAKNFYINHTDIFHPQVAWDGSGPGYTEGEFQIYSYMMATSYRIFGFWEPTGRVISFLFSIFTLLLFFKLSRYLLKENAALVASACFAFSPILMVISNTIQPESVMFFFYVASAYTFLIWLDTGTKKYLWLTIFCTALTLLCKLTAANIGLMFLVMMLYKKGWKFLFTLPVLLLGVFSLLPSLAWYWYSHQFYIKYGNSLGLSNEYAWFGKDFFTDRSFITGIIRIELLHVWTKAGPILIALALLFTSWRKQLSTLIGAVWYAAAFILYILAMRTTSADWAYYYHIFSAPAAALLTGSAIAALYEHAVPALRNKSNGVLKSSVLLIAVAALTAYLALANGKYFWVTKKTNFETSSYYSCTDSLRKIIPQGTMFLAQGGLCSDTKGYPKAYNNSYFFYWLNRKGYNICVGDLSADNIAAYKAKGAVFFVAEEKVISQQPGLETALKQRFTTVYECNGCIVFKL